MHYVGRVDWSFADTGQEPTDAASGLALRCLIGRNEGAIHSELAVGALAKNGWIRRHVHSFEEALYVLGGELALELDGHVHALRTGDYALIPVGVWHALANTSDEQVRWLAANTPQRVDGLGRFADTFYAGTPVNPAALAERAQRPRLGSPTLQWVGHYDGTPPQSQALAIKDATRGRRPAGMDTALLAYSGISVKMLVDRNFGASLLTMFTVDYEIGGAAQAHDHPFEETYFFLAGVIEAEFDGRTYSLRGGDIAFAGVGSVHGFYNTGTERVAWIETQAPQPPDRHAYRWIDSWKAFKASDPG